MSGCNGEGVVPLVRVDSFGVQAMVTPSFSPSWISTVSSIDVDGNTTASKVSLFLDAFGSGDFPTLSSGLEYAISSTALLSSDVPDSELQVSVFHTLNVETDD